MTPLTILLILWNPAELFFAALEFFLGDMHGADTRGAE